MAIRPRNGAFQADFTFRGERYRKSFVTKLEADKWEAETRSKLLKGEPIAPVRESPSDIKTLDQLLQHTYDRHWVGTKAKDTSWANANDCIKILGGARSPSTVDERAIDALVTEFRRQGLSGGTINRKLSALSKMLKHGFSRGSISRLPRIERMKESEHRIRWLSAAEEERVFAWFSFTNRQTARDFFTLLIDSGCRLSEGLGLEWRDVSEDWIRLWGDEGSGGDGTKTGKSRSIPQTERVKALLARRKAECPEGELRVFHDFDRWAAEYSWKCVRDYMGLDKDAQFVIHCLRHTFCSRLAQKGVRLLTIQQLAGHKTVTVTMRYAHLAPANLVDAINVLQDKSIGSTASVTVTSGDSVTPAEGVTVTQQKKSA